MSSWNSKLVHVTFLCAVLFFAWSTQDRKIVRIPTRLVLKYRQDAEVCSQENGVPASYLKKIIDKTLPDELPSWKFFYCLTKLNDFTDDKGRFVIEKLTEFEVADGPVEDYVNTIKECNKLVKDDPVQTLRAVSTCVHEAYHFVAITPNN